MNLRRFVTLERVGAEPLPPTSLDLVGQRTPDLASGEPLGCGSEYDVLPRGPRAAAIRSP